MPNTKMVGLHAGWDLPPALDEIFITFSSITGTLPSNLWAKSNLTQLHLYQNDLYGSIPSTFTLPPKLAKLELVRGAL